MLLDCPVCFKKPQKIFDNGFHGTKSYTCCGIKNIFGKEFEPERKRDWNEAASIVKCFIDKNKLER
jgi:hypothetical protein